MNKWQWREGRTDNKGGKIGQKKGKIGEYRERVKSEEWRKKMGYWKGHDEGWDESGVVKKMGSENSEEKYWK